MGGWTEFVVTGFARWLPALVVAFPALFLFGWHLRIQARRNEALDRLVDLERRFTQVEDSLGQTADDVSKLTEDQRFLTRLMLENGAKAPYVSDH